MSNSLKKHYECVFLPTMGTSTCSTLSRIGPTCSMLSASTCFAVDLCGIRINVNHMQWSIKNSITLINSLPGIEA